MNLKKELDDEKVINYANKAKDILMFALLALFVIMPMIKQLKVPYSVKNEYKIVWMIGSLGVYFLIFYQIVNYRQSKDKREYRKAMLPIILLAAYMLWTLISCLFAENKTLAFFGNTWRHDGYITYIAYSGFFALAFYMSSNKLKITLLNIFLIVVFLVNMTVFLESKFDFNIFWASDTKRAVFYNLNHYGYYLLLATIVSNILFFTAKNKKYRTLYLLMYVYFLYALIHNNTFGCYLALFTTLIILLIYTIMKKEKKVLAIVSIVVFILTSILVQAEKSQVFDNIKNFFNDIHIASSLFTDEPEEEWKEAGTKRLDLWVNGIIFFSERPIIGYGPENLKSKYVAVLNKKRQDRPHNIIIQQLTTSGIVGAVLYFAAIGIIAVRSFKKLKTENIVHMCAHFACTAYLASAMFGNSMFYTSPYFYIFLGFTFCETIKEYKNEKIKIG